MKIRILFVDPDQNLLDAYRTFLTKSGMDVQTACTGPDCVANLREWIPDVLVLEPDMPDDWGWEILDHVNRSPGLGDVPVLILSCLDSSTVVVPEKP